MMRRRICYKLFVLVLVTLAFCLCFLNINLWQTMKQFRKADFVRKTLEETSSKLLSLRVIQQQDRQHQQLIRRYEEKECQIDGAPQKSIFYIKVHKTGSTTLRSTLLIYGRQYNLTICMDSTNLWGLNWPYQVDNGRLTKPHKERCQIVAEELVYSPAIVDEIMADDVFVMTSVRHPVQHFMSLFKWSNIQKAVEKLVNKPLDKWSAVRVFLQDDDLVRNMYATFREDEVRDELQINLVRPNLQLYSLGLTAGSTFSEIEQRVREIDLIVVAENYDESMLILRDKLCCALEDLAYRKQNVKRSAHEKEKEVIPADIEEAITHFNLKDMYLYKLAMKRLYEEILQRQNFEQILGIYRYELKKYEQKCNANSTLDQETKDRLCPPTDGEIGIFLERIRNEQRDFLREKLRKQYKQRQ